MAIVFPTDMRPKNASAWSSSIDFWRQGLLPAFSPCWSSLRLEGIFAPAGTEGRPAVSGGWLAALTGSTCAATSDTYVTTGTYTVWIDVWAALEAGLWSGSVAFSVYARRASGAAGNTMIGAGPENYWSGSNPAGIDLTKAVAAAAGCPTTLFATLTVFDDGTFTYV